MLFCRSQCECTSHTPVHSELGVKIRNVQHWMICRPSFCQLKFSLVFLTWSGRCMLNDCNYSRNWQWLKLTWQSRLRKSIRSNLLSRELNWTTMKAPFRTTWGRSSHFTDTAHCHVNFIHRFKEVFFLLEVISGGCVWLHWMVHREAALVTCSG